MQKFFLFILSTIVEIKNRKDIQRLRQNTETEQALLLNWNTLAPQRG
jgi:hypothetical protein